MQAAAGHESQGGAECARAHATSASTSSADSWQSVTQLVPAMGTRSSGDRAIFIERRRRLRQSCHITSCHPTFFVYHLRYESTITSYRSAARSTTFLSVAHTATFLSVVRLFLIAGFSGYSSLGEHLSVARLSSLSARFPLLRVSLFHC